MRIALVAHDKQKDNMVAFVQKHLHFFKKHELVATGRTGKLLREKTGLHVYRFLSGPLGGDQQIGARIATEEIDLLIFFRDPLTAQPHEPDINAVLRICDVHNVPAATNVATAELLVAELSREKAE